MSHNTDQDNICLILPHGSGRSRAYVAFPVDERLASRSPVMETLIETEGIANLPEGIQASEFLKWCNTDIDAAASLPAEEVCVALRVRALDLLKLAHGWVTGRGVCSKS